jgi:peroxiredoxin
VFNDHQVQVIACVSVNDPFVMAAWGEAHKVGDKIRMLADTKVHYRMNQSQLHQTIIPSFYFYV